MLGGEYLLRFLSDGYLSLCAFISCRKETADGKIRLDCDR